MGGEGKDTSFLLRGRDLREAEQWVAKSAEKEPKPTTLHSQYILASRQSATRTQRIIIGAVAVAALIAVGLAIYALRQRNAANANAAEAKRQQYTAVQNETKAKAQEGIAKANADDANHQRGIAEEKTVAAERNAREPRHRLRTLASLEPVNTT